MVECKHVECDTDGVKNAVKWTRDGNALPYCDKHIEMIEESLSDLVWVIL